MTCYWSCLLVLAIFSYLYLDFVHCWPVNQSKSHAKKHRHANQEDAAAVSVSGGCATAQLSGNAPSSGTPTIPEIRWMETPSVVEITQGHFRVLGRKVHLQYVKEQLISQGVSFDAQREARPPAVSVEILADSLYIQDQVQLPGIQTLKLYTRKIVTAGDGEMDVSAPSWNQIYDPPRPSPERKSNDGYLGIAGPRVEIYANVIQGSLRVISNGGNGSPGQEGARGGDSPNSLHEQSAKTATDCTKQKYNSCNSFPPVKGKTGPTGGAGGDAGEAGDGGDSGIQRVFVNTVEGSVELRTCRGNGAPAPHNGQGGNGGLGGAGNYGRKCKWYQGYHFSPTGAAIPLPRECRDNGRTSNIGARGDTGARGPEGRTPEVAGSPGSVTETSIKSSDMDDTSKHSYPLALLRLMRRHAEDLLWADNLNEGRQVLRFIKDVTLGNTDPDARDMFKEARRRLGLLGKAGFDLFGYNELFAPRTTWEALKEVVENLREIATTYEDAYNKLSETIEAEESFEQIATQMSAVAGSQVEAEKKRLIESKLIAESEKRLYVQAIGELENRMDGIITSIQSVLTDVVEQARFNEDDLLAVLQAVCGFASAVVEGDTIALIDNALGVAFGVGEKKCPLGTLENNAETLKKWLTFGKSYQALTDSSELDFDQVDVEAVPEVMQANLEMNKEGLAADLVCLLEVQSRPQDVAELTKLIENFFINGAARIDLIAKVMDLDNDLGGLIFDIPLLEETENALTTLTAPTDTPTLNKVRSEFMENLLSIYQELEGSFMKEVYGLFKAFRFRTLWETENPLPEFQRVASEGAQGKTLNGIIELTNVLRDIQNLETTAVKCFTNNIYTTDIQRWSFTQQKDPTMFDELHTGSSTTFNIDVTNSCTSCFNIRLLKLYVELTGGDQPDNVPLTVHLQVRHLSASFFRSGDGSIKEFRQSLGSFRKMKFRRSALSNEIKCGEEEMKGNKNSIYCVTPNDDRWQGMCSLSALDDSLLGEEECRSPFGTYELVIPVDDQLSCDDPGITNKNCKDLNLSRFTEMNVWAQFYYWSEVYPTGPDDRACLSPVPPGVI